jgi:hypothetical protein
MKGDELDSGGQVIFESRFEKRESFESGSVNSESGRGSINESVASAKRVKNNTITYKKRKNEVVNMNMGEGEQFGTSERPRIVEVRENSPEPIQRKFDKNLDRQVMPVSAQYDTAKNLSYEDHGSYSKSNKENLVSNSIESVGHYYNYKFRESEIEQKITERNDESSPDLLEFDLHCGRGHFSEKPQSQKQPKPTPQVPSSSSRKKPPKIAQISVKSQQKGSERKLKGKIDIKNSEINTGAPGHGQKFGQNDPDHFLNNNNTNPNLYIENCVSKNSFDASDMTQLASAKKTNTNSLKNDYTLMSQNADKL